MQRDNRDAVLDPFCWVVLDQIWAEIFLAVYKGLGDGTRQVIPHWLPARASVGYTSRWNNFDNRE